MDQYGILDAALEDSYHKHRLLQPELRPFKNLSNRLAAADSPVFHPPPIFDRGTKSGDGTDDSGPDNAEDGSQVEARMHNLRLWREEVLLDLAAFDSSIIRAQYVQTSNEKERARYSAQKLKIAEDTEMIRQSISGLREQLTNARTTLTARKEYDVLADKILGSRVLRSREDQAANLAKLRSDIADLEAEASDHARTWSERRQQFGRIVDEGSLLRRMIRGEEHDLDRRDGMQTEEGDDPAAKSVISTRAPSRSQTPLLHAQRAGRGQSTQRIDTEMTGSSMSSPAVRPGTEQMDTS